MTDLAQRIHAEIAKTFEIHSPVVIRSARELQAVVEGNPFLAEGAAEDALHVMFLADKPAAAAVRTLEPERSPGDRFEVRGKDVFLCLPNGVARTKLSNAYFDSRLKTVSTGRNWRTVLKLHALVSG